MKANGNYIAVYSRKSKFTGKGDSIGNQIDFCKEYIRVHFNEIPPDHILVYEDEGFSGGDLNRPDFRKMMDAARRRTFQAIIVYRLDRISRNISDFSRLIEDLSNLGIAFISIREQFDTNTPMGRAMMYIASIFSQLERETIAERIRDNMHELAKTGRWLGGTTPTGYASEEIRSIMIDGKIKKSCRLRLIPEEAEIVRMIYQLYIEQDSLTATETELIRRRIKTKNHKLFTRFSIKAILQNPVYMIADENAYDYLVKQNTDLNSEKKEFDGSHGIMVYNRTRQEKGKTATRLPPDKWIAAVGLHPGIIPGKIWVSVQESLDRNRNKSYHKPRKNKALLTGLLYCTCGSRMYPRTGRQITSCGEPLYTYVCGLKERSKRTLCSGKNVCGNDLDNSIMTQIRLIEEDKDSFIRHLKQYRKFWSAEQTSYDRRLDSMRKENKERKNKISSLIDILADSENGPAENQILKRIEQLTQEASDMDSRIHELENRFSVQTPCSGGTDSLLQHLSVFQTSAEEMTIEQKRSVIRSLVRKIVWDGGNAHIVLSGRQENNMGFLTETHWGEDSK